MTRYSAFVLSLTGQATVRPSDIGISDVEWHHGVRCVVSDTTSFHSTVNMMDEMGYIVLTTDEWLEELASFDDPVTLQVDHFKSTHVRSDPWGTRREIY